MAHRHRLRQLEAALEGVEAQSSWGEQLAARRRLAAGTVAHLTAYLDACERGEALEGVVAAPAPTDQERADLATVESYDSRHPIAFDPVAELEWRLDRMAKRLASAGGEGGAPALHSR